MCGRYSLTTPVEGLRSLFEFPEQPNLEPRYNIAPTQEVAAVRAAPPAGATEGAVGQTGAGAGRHLVLLRWGLIPSWGKDPYIGARMINARAETLTEKPAFRSAFRKRRCLVAADGFYEWQQRGTGPKQPYRIAARNSGPFAFAGLWERWRNPAEGHDVESCTIVTTEANERLRAIHHRMPVILAPEAYDLWLDPETPGTQAQALLGPAPSEWFTTFRVSPKINSPANDDPALIEPLDEECEASESAQPRLL